MKGLEPSDYIFHAASEPGLEGLGDVIKTCDSIHAEEPNALIWMNGGPSAQVNNYDPDFRTLLPKLGAAAFPRRIRFVRTLPSDARGKTTAAAVRNELTAWCREPIVTDWRQTGDAITAKLVFSRHLECFNGHFPGLPILPGVAQLYFLRHFAQQVFADFPDAATYRRLKFQKVVLPGSEASLAVARLGPGEFSFTLDGPNGRASSGLVQDTL